MKMETDSLPVLCFQHCDRSTNVFCFSLPPRCSLCGGDLMTGELRIPPFQVPSPFTPASTHICSIVIKPVTGTFLLTYQNSTDLHIGITDSKGIVHEYDKKGLTNNETHRWNQCLTIKVLPHLDRKWMDFWDYTFQVVSYQEIWTESCYNPDDHNCYKFVLTFLRALQLPSLSKAVKSKTDFCHEFIIPRTTHAAKYITVYRKLIEEGTFVQTKTHPLSPYQPSTS